LFVAYIITESTENTTMAKTSKAARRQRTAPPADETPAGAFVRLSTGRTNKAIKAISLIGQLTGSSYSSSPVQQRAIVTALEAAVEQVKDTFEGKIQAGDEFKLPT